MSDTLDGVAFDISLYVSELHGLAKTIKHLDEAITEDRDNAGNQVLMQEVIDRYKTVTDKLITLLECYFAEERREGLPADFSLRRLYKRLTA